MKAAAPPLAPDSLSLCDVLSASPIGIAVENFEGHVLFVNPAFCSMIGLTEQEVRGRHCAEFCPSEDSEKDWALFQQLRAGSIDQYQLEKRYFRRDGSLVWGNLSVSLLKTRATPLVLAMVEDITAKKTAEVSLAEVSQSLRALDAVLQSQEELLRIFVKSVPAGVAMLDRDMRYVQVSDRWCEDYSINSSRVLGRSHYELLPDMPDGWKEIYRHALEGETIRADEDRWDRESGTMWLRWEVRPWRRADGAIGGILIFSEDITRRKQSEEALSGMSRKLIESQEQECARIGRELHDDVNQRLAMLVIGLQRLQDNPLELPGRLQELQEETMAILDDVQALSHELHASKLEHLGVVSGMKSWCKEFAERQKIEIEFKSDVVCSLPFEIGLPLFRVLQEALHNVVKHSGVRSAEVQITEQTNEVHLIVRDSGMGFEIEAAKRGRGLGLTSMRERLKLINGDLLIESTPGKGTSVRARVPLRAGTKAVRACA